MSFRDGSNRATMRVTAGVMTFSPSHSRSRADAPPLMPVIWIAASSAGSSHPRSARRIASGWKTEMRKVSSSVRGPWSSRPRRRAPIRCDCATACMPEYIR